MSSTPAPASNGPGVSSRPRLVVCADDYALTPGVSRAIRELLAARRISATSVMTVSEFWPSEAGALQQFAVAADIGLHVTLTDQMPLGPMATFAPAGRFPTMGEVYKMGILRRLPIPEIVDEIERQVAAFVSHFGAPPAYLDGHHHVHQLPGVRDIVVDVAARLGQGRVWVRCCRERPMLVLKRGVAMAKALAIGGFGGGIEILARQAGVPVNRGFSGAYDYLGDTRPIGELFERFVHGADENTLVMCHPGYVDAELDGRDAMKTPRETEFAYLMSDAWPELLRKSGLDLGPLRRS